MAKVQKGGGAGTARIRLVILEAEAPDGDLSQITAAVQNALRPAEGPPAMRRAISAPAKAQAAEAEPVELSEAEEHIDEGQNGEHATPAAPRARVSNWKPRSPDVIDLDLKSGEVPFTEYAQKKNPSSHPMKNLVVAAWFKLYRGTDAITMDHVYTCYRAMEWPSGMEDFGITLRTLKRNKLMENPGKGQYAINHIGMAKVDKLGGGNGV